MKQLVVKAELSVSDTGEIEAVAWPFASPDRVNDTIDPTALAGVAGKTLPMLFAHEQSEVVGVWHTIEIAADALRLKGRLLIDKVQRAAEVFAMLKEGAVRGVSIGFDPLKYTARAGGGKAYSLIDLLEASIVAVPCHPGASITSVKSEGHKDMADTPTPAADAPDNAALATRLDGIAADVTSINGRLDSIEVQLGRPNGADTVEASAKVERKAFTSFIRTGTSEMLSDTERSTFQSKVLRVGSDQAGGYLAPGEWSSELLKNLVEHSPVREAARVSSMSVGEIKIPRRLSGLTAQWVGEIEERPKTEPVYGQTELVAHEMSCWVPVSNQLLEDSAINIESELSTDFAEEFGRLEGAAFVNGDGNKKPLGIMHDNAGVPVRYTGLAGGSGAAANYPTDGQFADALMKLLYDLPQSYRRNGVWMMNGQTIGRVRLLKDNNLRFLWQEGIAADQPALLLGKPVVEAPDMADFAPGATPILFGDVNAGYRIYDRVGTSVLRNPYSLDTFGQTKFTARRRVAGAVVRPDAMRRLKVAAAA